MSKKLSKVLQEPKNAFRGFIFKFIKFKAFEHFILFCIVLNTITMALKFYLMPVQMNNFFTNLNYFFAAVFNIEAILKIIGMGRFYFYETWNM